VLDLRPADRIDVSDFDLPGRLPRGAVDRVGDDVHVSLGNDRLILHDTRPADLEGIFLFG
jgi:hypothetical protein